VSVGVTVEVVMPRLSDTMAEGTIVSWSRADGEPVSRGEEIVEIETDKATVGCEATASGTLEIVAPAGTTLPVGALIARIGGGGGDVVGDGDGDMDGEGRRGGAADVSPVARRLAARLGIDLSAVAGSGPGGRIVKADVERASAGQPASTVQLSRLQQTVARRMSEAHATIPDFALSAETGMDAVLALIAELAATGGGGGGARRHSINDLVVKATALALRADPRANGSYQDGVVTLHDHVNIGIAVAAGDALLVPTIFDADRLSLSEISTRSRRLAERARAGTLTPAELSGATFTISNLGMYGVGAFTAVINPPQAAILAVGAVREEPVVRDGAVVPGHRMTLTLSCDHRILYGADGARLLARIREHLEAPLSLVLTS
jgi:pyruvate dehydrogenase E2 component (dihydrolipoamide acetyltransferase)